MINDQYTLVMVIFLLLKVDQNDQLNLVIMHDQLELVGLTKSRMTVYILDVFDSGVLLMVAKFAGL